MTDPTIKEMVLTTLKNHKNCTSGGIANLLNVNKVSVLRALSSLIKEGAVKRQVGRVVDGFKDENFRSYKLKKEMFIPLSLFDEKQLTA